MLEFCFRIAIAATAVILVSNLFNWMTRFLIAAVAKSREPQPLSDSNVALAIARGPSSTMSRLFRTVIPESAQLPVCAGIFLSAILAVGLSTGRTLANDWPQILGPARTGIGENEKITTSLPAEGPPKVWEARIGSGFAGVAVAQNLTILFHRLGDDDNVTAYDAGTGKEIWSTTFPTDFQPSIVEDDGPRAVPTIHKGRVYAFGSNGGLYCLDLKSGKKTWQNQTQEQFRAPSGYFGAGSSPLVEGDSLIVNVGGDKASAGIVAFDLETGAIHWKATSEQASYSSPIAATVNGTRHLLCLTRMHLVSLDPESGRERFRTPFGQRGPTVNAAIPVLIKNQVLLTASYGIGAELLAIHDDHVEKIWNDEVLSSQYTTPIYHDGAVYGVDGRQDGGPISLKCFDPMTRKLHWTKPGIGYSTLIAADGKLLVMQSDGLLRLVELNRTEYRELGSAKLLSGTTRALPALADGRFYVRNDSTLKCVSLKPIRP